MLDVLLIVLGLVILGVLVMASITIVRPLEKAVIERFGKFSKVFDQGIHFIIPVVDKAYFVNLTERMVDAEQQEIITKDNLNAGVDAQIYFKVNRDDESVKKSIYNVNNYALQIVQLARTTLRDVIGNLTLREANSERNKLNASLEKTLAKETSNWGIEIVRTELKEIQPPGDVQETMNKVVKAENERIAARDFASAREIEADGFRRAEIKKAEGEGKSIEIVANANAKRIQVVHGAAEKYFVGNAQKLKTLEVTENSLQDNSKVVLMPEGQDVSLILGEGNVVPVKRKDK